MKNILFLTILASLSYGQIAFPMTTLASKLTAKSPPPIQVASSVGINGISQGQFFASIMLIGGEAICVNNVIGKSVYGNRGCQGTQTFSHSAGETVYFGPPSYYYFLQPGSVGGACVASDYPVMPYIVMPSTQIWNCTAGFWTVSSPMQLSRKHQNVFQKFFKFIHKIF